MHGMLGTMVFVLRLPSTKIPLEVATFCSQLYLEREVIFSFAKNKFKNNKENPRGNLKKYSLASNS